MKALLCLTFLLIPMCSQAQDPNERYIEVTGRSEKEITPDNVELTVILKAQENVKKENELQEKERQILAAIRQFGVPDENISIDKVAGHRYGYYKTTSNRYQISKVYKIQLNTIEFLDDLIIRLFETGASNVSISRMTSNSMEEVKTNAAKEALEIARRRATEIAETMGVKIGPSIQIKEVPTRPEDLDYSYMAGRFFYQAQGIADYQQMDTENLSVRKILLIYTISVRFAIQ